MAEMKHTAPEGFVSVTEEQFFAHIGPKNVHPRSQRHETFWETPERNVLGYSTPGYVGGEAGEWFLPRAAISKATSHNLKDGRENG